MFIYFGLMGAIAAALWGSDIIAKEQRDKTVEFSLVLPVSRNRVVTAKALAALVNCIVFVLITWAASLVAVRSFNPEPAFYDYLRLQMQRALCDRADLPRDRAAARLRDEAVPPGRRGRGGNHPGRVLRLDRNRACRRTWTFSSGSRRSSTTMRPSCSATAGWARPTSRSPQRSSWSAWPPHSGATTSGTCTCRVRDRGWGPRPFGRRPHPLPHPTGTLALLRPVGPFANTIPPC